MSTSTFVSFWRQPQMSSDPSSDDAHRQAVQKALVRKGFLERDGT
jgi:hypothetical protein